MAKKEFVVGVISKYCKACGICVRLCPTHVLAKGEDGKAFVADASSCIGCKNCELHCPDFCIEVEERRGAVE